MQEPTLNPESGFLRLRLDFSYDGTNFFGWAKQPELRTIQGELEKALEPLTKNTIALKVAGRTDAGVHALGQVAHFDLPERNHDGEEWDLPDLHYRINRMLDEDIRIHKVSFAPVDFHARFSALSRRYIYKIADAQKIVPPLKRYDIATWYRPLDITQMQKAVSPLIGEFDFSAFCKARDTGTTIRRLKEFTFTRDENGYIITTVSADAFCYSMVRNLIGAAVCVGEGRFEPEWMKQTLDNKVRISESLVFPARGLTLLSIEYPPDNELAARAEITVRRRDEDDS